MNVLDFSRCPASFLLRALANSIVVMADPLAAESSCIYRSRAQPWLTAVSELIAKLDDAQLRAACDDLRHDPRSAEKYLRVVSSTGSASRGGPSRELLRSAWLAEKNSRISYELGPGYDAGAACYPLDRLLALPAVERGGGGSPGHAEVLIVVPFRCRDDNPLRARNLVACLRSLRDQSFDRERYRVVVTESDAEPRWEREIRRLADDYIFAANDGMFNKSWAVNVGVKMSGADPSIVCVLDADVLCDTDFVRRNVGRLDAFGSGAHLPYRDMSCLDPVSTSAAVRDRCELRKGDVEPSTVRSFTLRRPPGACVWIRAEVFWRIGGMDERYEGWGGEDDDLKFRLDLAAPLDCYHDRLWHMYHPASAQLVDGRIMNMATIPPLSWPPGSAFGQLER